MMLSAILACLLKNATFNLYTSGQPIGRRLGGHDIPGIADCYIILHIEVGGQIVLLGYFQTA
jgi:hypothetical protein